VAQSLALLYVPALLSASAGVIVVSLLVAARNAADRPRRAELRVRARRIERR
jgi:hypothetical protein